MPTSSPTSRRTTAPPPVATNAPPDPLLPLVLLRAFVAGAVLLTAAREALLAWAATQPSQPPFPAQPDETFIPWLAATFGAPLVQAILRPPFGPLLALVTLAGLAALAAELSLAALWLVAGRLLAQRTAATYLRIRLARTAQAASALRPEDGAALHQALHAALAQPARAGARLTLTLNGLPDEPIALGAVLAGRGELDAPQGRSPVAAALAALRAQLAGMRADVVLDRPPDPLAAAVDRGRAAGHTLAWRSYALALPPAYPLRAVGSAADEADPFGGLLAALRPRAGVTATEIQVGAHPRGDWALVGGGWRTLALRRAYRLRDRDDYSLSPDLRALEAKLAGSAFDVTVRAVVVAETPAAARAALDAIGQALGAASARSGSALQRLVAVDQGVLRLKPTGERDAWRTEPRISALLRRTHRSAPPPRILTPLPLWQPPAILSAGELASLWRLPDTENADLIRWLPCRVIPPDPRVLVPAAPDQRWITVGHALRSDGRLAPVGTTLKDLCEVMHITAGMGAGKSRLLANLCQQCIEDGFILLDGKGDDAGSLAATVRKLIPLGTHDRLVVLDVLDAAWPVGLNPLAGVDSRDPAGRSRCYGQVEALLARLDPESWGNAPGMRQFLQMATFLVLECEAAPTFAHIKQCLLDDAYRARMLAQARDREVITYWTVVYPRTAEAQKTSRDALVRRLDALLVPDLTRYMLTQAHPPFDFLEAIEQRKIVIIPIPHRALGALAEVIAVLLLQAVVRAAYARPGEARTRRPYPLVIDELQVLIGAGDGRDIRDAISQLRGLGIAGIYAHQALSQLGNMRDEMLLNAGSRIILRTQEPDASVYARQYPNSGLTAGDLAGQDRDEHQYAVLMRNGEQVGPISVRPLGWPAPANQQPWIAPLLEWQTLVPEDSPTPRFDHQVLRLVYGDHADPEHLSETFQDDSGADWDALRERWAALRQHQQAWLWAHPGLVHDPWVRQQWLGRLACATPRILAQAEYVRIRRAIAPDASPARREDRAGPATGPRIASTAPIAGLSQPVEAAPLPPPPAPPAAPTVPAVPLSAVIAALRERTQLRNPEDTPPVEAASEEIEEPAGEALDEQEGRTGGVGRSWPQAGLLPPDANPSESELLIDILRTLGRLEFALGPALWQLFGARQHYSTLYRRLQKYVAQGLIWRSTEVPLRFPRDLPPLHRLMPRTGRTPVVYGLTPKGKELLIQLGDVEVDERHHRLLRARDLGTQPISPAQSPHDVQASWYCVSVLREAARHPWCTHVFLQMEFVVTPGASGQRIDAVLVLRLSPTHPRPQVGRIPYFDSSPRRTDEREVRLAIEIDRGTEHDSIIRRKLQTYRELTEQGVYTQVFGGPVLPVFIVPTVERAAAVAVAAQQAWPGGPGLVTTAVSAEHPEHGVLWGAYYRLRELGSIGGGTEPAPAPLLTELGVGADGDVREMTICDLAAWAGALPRPE